MKQVGGEYGVMNQFFGDKGGAGSVVGGWLTGAFNSVKGGIGWWQNVKNSAGSQDEMNMYNLMEQGTLAILAIWGLNKVANWTDMSPTVKWALLAGIVMYFFNRSGKTGQEMRDYADGPFGHNARINVPFSHLNDADKAERMAQIRAGSSNPSSAYNQGGGGNVTTPPTATGQGVPVQVMGTNGQTKMIYVSTYDDVQRLSANGTLQPLGAVPPDFKPTIILQTNIRGGHVGRDGDTDKVFHEGLNHSDGTVLTTEPFYVIHQFKDGPATVEAGTAK